MSKIICVGSASKDIFFPTGEGIFVDTPEDITSQQKVQFEVGAKYQVEDRFEAVGGVAANGAQGLARLGMDVAVYSSIGNDQIGEWVVDELQKENVKTNLIVQTRDAQTDLSAILVFTQNGERTIFFNRDANELLTVDAEKLIGAEWISVSALNGKWQDNLQTILKIVRENNIKLAVNPGQRNMKDDMPVVLEAVKQADILLVNKDEAIELALAIDHTIDSKTLQDERFLLTSLYSHGAKTVALTDGVRGAWGYDGVTALHIDVVARKVVDATGSGDAFGSGFLAAWIHGYGLETALRWGIANGSSVVQFFGAREGLLRELIIEKEAKRASAQAI